VPEVTATEKEAGGGSTARRGVRLADTSGKVQGLRVAVPDVTDPVAVGNLGRQARGPGSVTYRSAYLLRPVGALRHDLNDNGPALPEHVVDSGLQIAQRIRRRAAEAEHDRGPRSRSVIAVDPIEWRKAVFDKEIIDFVIRSIVFNVSHPQISHKVLP